MLLGSCHCRARVWRAYLYAHGIGTIGNRAYSTRLEMQKQRVFKMVCRVRMPSRSRLCGTSGRAEIKEMDDAEAALSHTAHHHERTMASVIRAVAGG